MPDKSLPPRDNPLSSSDAGLARVTEDLPLAAQNKLLERKETRARLSNSLDLLGDDSGNETI
jgi:hypothetical protein